ncbi:MAG: restriction endonuclease subunit S [Pseudomonas sp.]|nr:restriction endonuclease subunit S [Xanthomonadaceae bacterium]MDZ4326048.1 restriction endonuclease subunit S [Pseudomonas sp.]
MSLPRYAEYKDSGVASHGLVPSHWQVKRLRFVAELNPSKSEVASVDRQTQVSFLPMDAIGDDGAIRLDETRTLAQVENGYTYFRDGDVVIAKITPCFENGKGAVIRGLLDGVGFGTTELIVVRPKPQVATSDYLGWLFTSPTFRKDAEGAMYGAGGQKRVPDSFVRDYLDAVPPLDEQSTIATFLDRETGKIDALIAEQEKLLTLLAEKRQATISHAVTRGLNPNAPMKDSGVAWLGEVPAHWLIVRIKHVISSIEQGWSPQCENYPAETSEEWGVLKVGCVNGGVFRPSENKRLPDELEPMSQYALRQGDLLISRANTRDLVGGAAVVTEDHPKLLLCDKLYRLRIDGACCLSEFLAALLGADGARSQIELQASGASSSMLNIGQSVILDMPVALPPIEEQFRIVDFITTERRRLEELQRESKYAIDLLKERRSALVAAAVTGKIDVRNFAKMPV